MSDLFGNEPFWVVALKSVLIFVFLLVYTLFNIWFERRVVAKMQHRIGPNVHGPFGLLQSLADGVKLALKEDIVVKAADKAVYILAPILAVIPAFLAWAVIPFGPEVRIPFTDTITPLQLTDLPVAVLYVLAVTSIGVYGIVLAGWSSGSIYALLGGLRSSAQVISYEVAMGLSFVSVFMYAGSMSTSEIVAAQSGMWYFIPLFPSFVIYCIAMVGETNRAPFFLAEYINMVTVSALATTLFLGGWRAPFGLAQINDGYFNTGYWPVLWFFGKTLFFIFIFVWLRGTLPRMRYDQFMSFGWKILIPISLAWIVAVTFIRKLKAEDMLDQGVLVPVAIVVGVLALLTFLIPEKKPDAEPDEVEFDAFAGGYPVPPMPGQTTTIDPAHTQTERTDGS
jgi:NADH-quinone oxidoreductase subunit H